MRPTSGSSSQSVIASLVDACLSKGVLKKGGAWIKFGELSFQGAANLEEAIRAEPELEAELREALVRCVK